MRHAHHIAWHGVAAVLACSLLLPAGCASLETIAPPVATFATRGKDTALLESGRRIYLENCTECHAPDPVSDYADAWPRIIRKMALMSKLTPAQEHAVLAYVLAAEHVQ